MRRKGDSDELISVRIQKLTLFALLVFAIHGCSSQRAVDPYLKAQEIRNFGISADLWLLRVPDQEGFLPYFYDPESDQFDSRLHDLGELHALKHLTDRSLNRDPFVQPTRDLLAAINSNWIESHKLGTRLVFDQSSSLGANALWLRVQIAQFLGTQDPALGRQISANAEFIRKSFDLEKGFPERFLSGKTQSTYYQRYYSAQATLVLLEHSQAFNDSRSLMIADQALSWLTSRYPTNSRDDFHPSLVPWLAFSIAKHYSLTGQSNYLNDLFSMTKDLADLQADADFPGRFGSDKTLDFGRPNAVRDALSTLALLESLQIAEQLQETRLTNIYRKAIWLALEHLRSQQYDHGGVSAFPKPINAVGAIRLRHDEALVRLDATVFGAQVFEKAAELIQNGVL